MDKLAAAETASQRAQSPNDDGDSDSSGSETEREDNYRTTTSRPKGESTDDKKARKAAVKAERAVCLSPFGYTRCDFARLLVCGTGTDGV